MSDEEKNSDTGEDWGAALEEQASAKGDAEATDSKNTDTADGDTPAASDPAAEPASMEQFPDEGAKLPTIGESERNMELLLDVPVTISMEIGNTRIPIRTLLQLSQGSVVELDRLAGEPLDVLVNSTLIAHGEVVVVNEKFGIRLTDVISPAERVRKLR